jgi:hypothetical protein
LFWLFNRIILYATNKNPLIKVPKINTNNCPSVFQCNGLKFEFIIDDTKYKKAYIIIMPINNNCFIGYLFFDFLILILISVTIKNSKNINAATLQKYIQTSDS